MKGIVFNLLEDAVTAEHGPFAWPSLMEAAGIVHVHSSLGSYPDEEMIALVEAAALALNAPVNEVLRWFGCRAIPLLAERYPVFFAPHRRSRSFITSVNDIIHPEVRKLYSGAGCPHFHFHDREDGRLGIAYQSPRKMCHLAHGFIEGAAAHFGETVQVEHLSCMLNDEQACRLAIRWVQ